MSAPGPWGLALRSLVAHVLLVLLWPLVAPVYAPLFRGCAQLALGVLAPLPEAVEVRLVPGAGGPLAQDIVRMDTVVELHPRALAGQPATFGASSFFHGYLPLSVLLALLAARARPWHAPRKPLVLALLVLHAGLLARFLPAIYYAYSKCTIEGRSPLGLGPDGTRTLGLLKHLAWDDMVPNYLLPLGAFALCALGARADDARRT